MSPRERRLLIFLAVVMVAAAVFLVLRPGGAEEIDLNLFPSGAPSVPPVVDVSPSVSPVFAVPSGVRDPFQ